MELLGLAIIIGIVLWYFGSMLNSSMAGIAKVASKEFELLQDEQEVRVAKSYNDLGIRLEKVLSESSHTKGSVKSMIKDMNQVKDK